MKRLATPGYIMVETVVAMGLLSIGMVTIQGAVRQAIITRGQAQDYTTARFLMEKVVADVELQPEVIEGKKSGNFKKPFNRFRYQWAITRVQVPLPPIPPELPGNFMEQFEKTYKGYMGKMTVTVFWTRAGHEFEAFSQTLLSPEQFWVPPEERGIQGGGFGL